MKKNKIVNGTKILTSKGLLPVEKLRRDIEIYGRDGHIHRVLEVYSQGKGDTYKVTFQNEVSILCDKDTIWSIACNKRTNKKVSVTDIQKILKKQFVSLPKISEVDFSEHQRYREKLKDIELKIEVEKFGRHINYDELKHLYYRTKPHKLTEKERVDYKLYDEKLYKYLEEKVNVIEYRPIHPYLIGLFISDMIVKLHKPSPDMKDWYFEAPHIVGGLLVKNIKRLKHDVKQIVVDRYNSNIYMTPEFWESFDKYIQNKVIILDNDVVQFTRLPDEYIYSKITVRHTLVRGFIDFNRFCQHSVDNFKCVNWNEIHVVNDDDYCTPKQLQEDKKFLLETLGFIIKHKENTPPEKWYGDKERGWVIKEVKKLPKQREVTVVVTDSTTNSILLEHCIPLQ